MLRNFFHGESRIFFFYGECYTKRQRSITRMGIGGLVFGNIDSHRFVLGFFLHLLRYGSEGCSAQRAE